MIDRTKRPLLFLDIDGVVLKRRASHARVRDSFEIAPHALLFLKWAREHFEVRWLSSRCQTGDGREACHAFRYALGARELPAEWRFLETIQATRWRLHKVEAIDLASDFYWIDDNHDTAALAILVTQGRADRAIETNADRDPDALLRTMRILAQRVGCEIPPQAAGVR